MTILQKVGEKKKSFINSKCKKQLFTTNTLDCTDFTQRHKSLSSLLGIF